MDELKKYLREKKDLMNLDEPDPMLWNNISKKRRRRLYVISYLVAASICLLIALTLYIFSDKKPDNSNDISKITPKNNPYYSKFPVDSNQTGTPPKQVAQADENMNKVRPDPSIFHVEKIKHLNKYHVKSDPYETIVNERFGEMQKSFAIIIKMQLNSVKSTPVYGENADYFNVFKKGFQDLDSEERGVKNEVKQNGLDDIRIEKLINVYEQKLILLKHLKNEIGKVNSHSQKLKNAGEKPNYINL